MSKYFDLLEEQLAINNEAMKLASAAIEELDANGETSESLRLMHESQALMDKASGMKEEIHKEQVKHNVKLWGKIALGFGLIVFVFAQAALDFIYP